MARIRNTHRNPNNNEKNNSYEEARKQRLQDNLKRFQDLGITTISKNLSEAMNSGKKYELGHIKTKSKTSLENLELRRSSRERGSIPSYREVEIDIGEYRRSYARRSSVVGRVASEEERMHALESAENLQSHLVSGHPSFVKSMVRSHVSSCFWLGLPRKFCKDHLPPSELKMVLEDQNGLEYAAIYIGSRTGLSGGWKGFASDHRLDEGDALVFELIERARFKVYIVKASEFSNQDSKENTVKAKGAGGRTTQKSAKSSDAESSNESDPHQNLKQRDGSTEHADRAAKRGRRE